jgi:hypothetical protein
MLVKKILAIILLFSLLTAIPGCENTNPSNHFVISTDGTPQPGTRQDFLIYQLDSAFKPTSQKISAKLEARNNKGEFSEISPNKGELNHTMPMHCVFNIPDDPGLSEIFLNLYSDGFSPRLLFSQKISVRKNTRLALAPPAKPSFCGEWLNLKIACFDPRNLKGTYKVPVRVRMQAPYGLTTVNRVIPSEIDGFINFTTYINSNAPQGLYKFEITSPNNQIQLKLPIFGADKRLGKLSENLPNIGISPMPKSPPKSFSPALTLSHPPVEQIIQTLRPGNQQIHFDFACASSSCRFAEVWQNGQLLNYSELPIEAGNSSHPLPRNFLSELPLRLKLWFCRNGKLLQDEKIVFFAQPENNPIQNFLSTLQPLAPEFKELPSLLLKSESLLIPSFASSTAPLHFFAITPVALQNESEAFPGKFDSNRLLDIKRKFSTPTNRFFLVENEFNLARFNFDRLKIHLNPKQFYRNFIASLYQPVSDIETIISETEARLLRFPLLSPPEQESELEKLEGLLLPIGEFATNPDSKTFSGLYARTLALLKALGEYIYLPEKLAKLAKTQEKTALSIGPVSPLLETHLNTDLLNLVLKPGGKVRIKAETGEYPVNLNSRIVDFKNRNGSRRTLEKIVNLRNEPVMIELIFRDPDQIR